MVMEREVMAVLWLESTPKGFYSELWEKESQDTTPTSLPTNTASDVRIGRNT
jgi:hypothetical protein